MTQLFRAEVYRDRTLPAFGRAIPLYAEDSRPLVAILVLSVLMLGFWLTTGSYARSEMVSGWVVPAGPTARILPAQRGTLVALDVREGQQVHKGDRLGVIEIQSANDVARDPAAQSLAIVGREQAGIDARRRLAAQGNAQDNARLTASTAQFGIRLAALDQQIALQRGRVASSGRSLGILATAYKSKYVSEIDYQSQRRGNLDEQAKLQSLIAERAGLQSELNDAQAQLRHLSVGLGETIAGLDADAMQLAQRRLDIESGRRIVLTAPIDGRVSALQGRVGQAVSPDMPVMYVLGGDAQLEVELYAPSRAIGFARAGQDVRLMYDAFPYAQFGSFKGRIAAISRTAMAPGEIDAPVKLAEPAFRIRVRLDSQAIEAFGAAYAVEPGMTLKANLILEKQSLLSWLLEPINAVRRRT
jgi:membrane fusion protein